ncbi:MAG: S8 family serine peptidase [Nitrospirota bacterium]
MKTITINGIAIDPAAPKPALAALSLHNATAKKSDYLVVQTKQPLDKEQRKALANAGAKIIESVPGDAFICFFPKTSLAKVRGLPFVEWAELYPEAVKIAPSLRNVEARRGGVPAAFVNMHAPGVLDATRKTVDVVLHRNADAKKAAKRIASAAHLPIEQVKVLRDKVRVVVKERRLADLAALDEVRHIEEVLPRKLHNSVARKILRMPAGNPVPGDEGAGEIVAVADTGFDKGSTTDVHPAFKGRVKKLYALGRPGRKDDPDGHGTHVAGSVLGDGVSGTEGAVRGTAPKAKLVLQSVLDADDGLGGLPDDLADLFKQPYTTDKARIHTNSWGSRGNFGVYDQQAFEVDKFVHEHRDMLICFSAGNEGTDSNADGVIDSGSVTPPATAKNCLTVGACENNRPNKTLTYGQGWPPDFPADPIKTDKVANNPEGIVAFSSRGPIHDGRIKPDVVAPGTFILSTRSRATQSTGWEASLDPLYMFEGGTSMATPLVAGCIANVRAFLRTSHGIKKPSAALLKALIINGARDLAGQYLPSEAAAIPNNNEGFGRVDVQAVVGPYGAGETVIFFDEAKALDTGQKKEQAVPVPAGAKMLKVTLVWTDPPGEGLQSDLDLIVKKGNKERHGNMPAGSAGFDRLNNVEQVMWTNIPAGPVTVTVAAHRATVGSQSFALVVRVK